MYPKLQLHDILCQEKVSMCIKNSDLLSGTAIHELYITDYFDSSLELLNKVELTSSVTVKINWDNFRNYPSLKCLKKCDDLKIPPPLFSFSEENT